MKALTLWQPWASLVAVGAKRIETRSWTTSYRGPLAIHAAKRQPEQAQRIGDWVVAWEYDVPSHPIMWEWPRGTPFDREQAKRIDLPLGCVIATCQVLNVLPIVDKPQRGEEGVGLDEDGIVRQWKPSEMAGYPMHVGEAGWSPDREEGWSTEHEAAYGDYTSGRWAWLLGDVRVLPSPIPARGGRGLWEWEAEDE